MKSLDKLMDIYLTSVGRGGVLLLDATPDTSGLIPESHLARYREFGAAIQRLYANKKARPPAKARISSYGLMCPQP